MLLTQRTQRHRERRATQRQRIDYSRFSHTTHVTKEKLTCDSCHKFPTKNWKEVRKAEDAFPDVVDFPEHAACLNCHREQFFARQRPAPAICSNCHVQATPRNTARFRFPSLDASLSANQKSPPDTESEFRVNFPHDKHADVIATNEGDDRRLQLVAFAPAHYLTVVNEEPASCAVCHKTDQPQGSSDDEYLTKPPADLGEKFWLKKGTFKTLPISHAACFTCHSTENEIPPLPPDCNACHKLATIEKQNLDAESGLLATMGISSLPVVRAWNRRDSSATFRHEVHSEIGCVSCHQIATMNTVVTRSLKVPVKSCGGGEGCHVTASTDDGGILNFEMDQRKTEPASSCTKCHVRFGTQPIPASHSEAILALQKK